MLNNKKVTVVIPAYNEEKSLPLVLDDISRELADDIIVVDNGSDDHTSDVADGKGVRVISEIRKGYGSACLKGLAESGKTDIIVILDADYSDYPEEMIRLVQPIAEGKYDFVLGSRIMGRIEKNAMAPQAYYGNKLACFLIKMLFGYKYTDMGPFRAIRYDALMGMNMIDSNYGWNAEMQIKALRKKLQVKEVPVNYRARLGKSKISGTVKGTVFAGYKIIYTIFKYAFMAGK